jgi:hypothetical protein
MRIVAVFGIAILKKYYVVLVLPSLLSNASSISFKKSSSMILDVVQLI